MKTLRDVLDHYGLKSPLAISAATEGLEPSSNSVLAIGLCGPDVKSIYVKGGDIGRSACYTHIPEALYAQAGQEPAKAVDQLMGQLAERRADLLLAYNAGFVSGFMQSLLLKSGRLDAAMPQYLDIMVVARCVMNGQFYMYPAAMTLQDLMRKLQQSPYDRKLRYSMPSVMEALGVKREVKDRPAHEQAAMDLWKLYSYLADLECLRLL